MEIGKVPNDLLQNIILDKIKNKRPEVMVRPGIGEDCSVVDFGEYACVMSMDPITGAANEVGRLAVHISCNDIASCGVEPLGLMVTILAPPGATESDLDTIMGQITSTASLLNVEILGGHTEVTSAVNRFVITSTAIGRIVKDKIVTSSNAKPGDSVILTKSAGLEGTAIIASDKEIELEEKLEKQVIDRAKSFINSISAVKEGVLAGEFGVSAMHDVTEGGVLGAVWEIAQASDRGIVIQKDKIPVEPETAEICKFYNIDPLKLISSGCMIITCADGEGLVKKLQENDINAAIIGKITGDHRRILVYDDKTEDIIAPQSDELYRVIE